MERAREVEPRRQLSSRKLELGRFLADLRQLRERLVGIAANRQCPAAAVFGDQFVDRPKNSIERRPSDSVAQARPPARIVAPAGHRGRKVEVLVENDGAAQGYEGDVQRLGDGPSRHRDLIDDEAFDRLCFDCIRRFMKRYDGELSDQPDGGAECRNSALLADVAPSLGESTSRVAGFADRMKVQTCRECLGLRIEEAEKGHPVTAPGEFGAQRQHGIEVTGCRRADQSALLQKSAW